MTKLPARLEQRLKQVFPRVKEREKFVADVIDDALQVHEVRLEEEKPKAIGGTLHLFTDGGSRGNPGQAAIGCVLMDQHGNILEEHSERIGIQTNNVAEYEALIAGMKLATAYRPNHLICRLDSELVVRQLNGEYRVKMQALQPLVEEIERLKKEFPNVRVMHVPRADNFRADALVNKALDGK